MKLAIATICPHILFEDRWWSYEPFVLEMNIWSHLFNELILVAPLEQGPPPAFWAPYQRSEAISVIPYRKDKGRGLEQERTSVREIPAMISAIIKAARKTDAFHVRSPGSVGLLSSLLVPLLQERICAKYAGQWTGHPGEARSVRLQRTILRSRWWRGATTVYGHWPNQPAKIIPFFTSVLTEKQIARAQVIAAGKKFSYPLRVLFVGRLSAEKNVDVLLSALAELKAQNILTETTLVGSGTQRSLLEARVRQLDLRQCVTFAGGVNFEKVLGFYERADVLVLASESEGWPKAIAEGMAFGLLCIGSDRGLVPQMLGEGRGIVVQPRNIQALAQALRHIVKAPGDYESMRVRAAIWAQRFTLESLGECLRELLTEQWGISIGVPPKSLDSRSVSSS
jgi:glycosyltransferase involved in cell wall biosynthesis